MESRGSSLDARNVISECTGIITSYNNILHGRTHARRNLFELVRPKHAAPLGWSTQSTIAWIVFAQCLTTSGVHFHTTIACIARAGVLFSIDSHCVRLSCDALSVFNSSRMFDSRLPTAALASFPRSGNTWTRRTIEHATGYVTGSTIRLQLFMLTRKAFTQNCVYLLHFEEKVICEEQFS